MIECLTMRTSWLSGSGRRILACVAVAVMMSLIGCKQTEQMVNLQESHRTAAADTLHFSDSLIYREHWKGDTLIIHEREIIHNYHNRLDSRTDTVVMKQVIEKDVDIKSLIQKLKMELMNLGMLVLFGLSLFAVVKKIVKTKILK